MRKQHFFLLLSIVTLILLYWFPIWHYQLGLVNDPQTFTRIDLLGFQLILEVTPTASMVIPDIQPSYWYMNTLGIVINLAVLIVAFIHFGDLKIQKRWSYLALASCATSLIFTFLQINLIESQYQKALSVELPLIGETRVGETILSLLSRK